MKSQQVVLEKKAIHSFSATSNTRLNRPRWYPPALTALMLFSFSLDFFQLGQNGYGNLYYAAAIKSMSMNWHNFFFVAFDPGGFISIDKPPLGFWLEALSAKIFGFSPWSVLLPSALAGVLSVLVLSHLVRRAAGPIAGLLAGVMLAITPISVITARNMTIDSQLTLVLLLATWMISLATETGRLRFLFLCALLIGLGFNIKTLDAYLVLPAFTLLYWFAAPHSWRRRLSYLLLATLVLLLISISWSLCVDLIPPAQRPFVGSSSTNSALQLSLFYNGIDRLTGTNTAELQSQAVKTLLKRLPAFIFINKEIGFPGMVRLIIAPLGEQIGWFIPGALLGLSSVRWDDKPSIRPLSKEQQMITLWGIWFLTYGIFFSSAGFFHGYYTVVFAPAICALAAIGMVKLCRMQQRTWILPVALLVSIAVQLQLLLSFSTYARWLIPPLLIISLLVLLLLSGHRFITDKYRRIIHVVTLGALLLAPLTWSILPVIENRNDTFPITGPLQPESSLEQLYSHYETELAFPDQKLINYLFAHQGHASYLVATQDSFTAAPLILETNQPVMALGGYNGQDKPLTHTQLLHLIHQGSVRFFLLPKAVAKLQIAPELQTLLQEMQQAQSKLGNQQAIISAWASTNCSPVSPANWQDTPSTTHQKIEILELYDCEHAES